MYSKGEAHISEDQIVLPHSCDEWLIGGKEEAQELINDLQDLIKQL